MLMTCFFSATRLKCVQCWICSKIDIIHRVIINYIKTQDFNFNCYPKVTCWVDPIILTECSKSDCSRFVQDDRNCYLAPWVVSDISLLISIFASRTATSKMKVVFKGKKIIVLWPRYIKKHSWAGIRWLVDNEEIKRFLSAF